MSIADKALTISANNVTIAENQQKVFDAGYENGDYDVRLAISKAISGNKVRTRYEYAFKQSDYSNFEFIEGYVTPTEPVRMFYDYLGKYLPKNIDFSKTTPSTDITQLFCWATSLLEIPDIGLPAMNSYTNVFSQAYKLKKIDIVRVHEGSTFTNTFTANPKSSLEEITFEGTIGQDLDMKVCPNLNRDSLINIITCLKDYSTDTGGTAHKLSLGSDNIDKLTTEEQQIITDKGWTLA